MTRRDAMLQNSESESGLPATFSKPAQRALAAAGYTPLEQLSPVSEAELLKLHGMGPKALAQLRQALAEQDMAFANKYGRDISRPQESEDADVFRLNKKCSLLGIRYETIM